MLVKTTTRVLDRVPFWDPRNEEHSVRRVLAPQVPLVKRVWDYPTLRLDQGNTGHCVGFGWSAELSGSPVRISGVDNNFAHGLFYAAQKVDIAEGRNFGDGATVIAGAKAAKNLGYMESYTWATTIDDLLAALVGHGPAVLGVNWREFMFNPTRQGLLDISGQVAGGHCITAFGFIPKMRFGLKRFDVIPLVQSWGTEFGRRGIAYLKVEDAEALLKDDGEACVPVHRLRPTIRKAVA